MGMVVGGASPSYPRADVVQATWLRDGRADVAFVHHPHDDLAV